MDNNTSFIQEHFDKIAPHLEQWQRRNRYFYREVQKLHGFLIPPGQRILEIGCGLGDLLASLEPSFGVGIDISTEIISLAKDRHPHLTFVACGAEQLRPEILPDVKPFDFILVSGVVNYLMDIQGVLQNLQAFCQPETRVIICCHNWLWQGSLKLAEKFKQRMPQPPENWLSLDDIRDLAYITGYEEIKFGRRFLIPKSIPLISAWVNRWLSPLPGLQHLGLLTWLVVRPQPQPLDRPTVSVIVPARNESGNIQAALERTPAMGGGTELIFVEGHSQDDTWEKIQEAAAHYQGPLTVKIYQQTGKGKGDAVRLGFAQATGDILMILDADLTVQPEDLPKFYEAIAQGRGEFVNGSRLVYARSSEAMPWLNTLANKFFALTFSWLLGQRLKDTLCGTKVLRRSHYLKIAENRHYFGEFDPFGDFDLLFGAAKLNLRIVEVPVRYQPRTYGSSNIAHVKEGLILLKMCWFAAGKIKFPV